VSESAPTEDPLVPARLQSTPHAGWFRDPAVVFREPLCVSPARARVLRERVLRVLAGESGLGAAGAERAVRREPRRERASTGR
jgi:hypothetical protein